MLKDSTLGEEAATTIASARAPAAEDDAEDDLDAVDADEDEKYEAFLEDSMKSSIRPLSDFQ